MMVKICGITNRDDALAAIEYGAKALGLNFWPRSPRYVPPQQAIEILENLPPGTWKVGVFVDETPQLILQTVARLGLDVVQIHGDAVLPAGLRVWKALPVDENFQLSSLNGYAAEAFLLDAPAGHLRGGSGRSFDWSRVAGAPQKIILAGGLEAGNVRQAIQIARPWGVDACSRLESSPGRKDHKKLAAFLEAVLESEGI